MADNGELSPGVPFMAFLETNVNENTMKFTTVALKTSQRSLPIEKKQRIFYRAFLGDENFLFQAKACDLISYEERNSMDEETTFSLSLSLIREWHAHLSTATGCPKCPKREFHFHLLVGTRTSLT